jgi:uncharacterized flavoprotein (TIGR03862 family)
MAGLAIIGGGPAGLMAAEAARAVSPDLEIHVFEAKPSLGRKLLMAGKSGLNITHAGELPDFLARYGRDESALRGFIEAFPSADIIAWMESLGSKAVIGSSGLVFPKQWKASPLLRRWLARLDEGGVQFHTRHYWRGWDEDGALLFDTPEGSHSFAADAVVFALGGASWPRLGSDGQWADNLAARGVAIAPFQASNVGVRVAWSDIFKARFAGEPIKNVAFSGKACVSRGEAVITEQGLEGGGIYALSAALRDELAGGSAQILINFLPDWPEAKIRARLQKPRGKESLSNFLRKGFGLSGAKAALLREAFFLRGRSFPPPSFDKGLREGDFFTALTQCPIVIDGFTPMERAISTVGGVKFSALDENLMLKAVPNHYCVGEMVDWDAPTGGYLLSACFGMGRWAGRAAAGRLLVG